LKINHLLDNSKKSIHSSSGASFLTWLTENGVEIDHAKELNTKIFSQLGLTNESGKIAVKAVEQHISGADYLSTIRNEQKRIYSDEDKSAFKSILESLDNARNNGFDFDNYLSECSKLFDVDGIFDFDYDSEKGIYFPSINGQSFVNVGFGLGQIALIIFKIAEHASKKYIRTNHGEYFFSNASSILILEEPESNLHPKFQSLLADLFVKAAETFNIQFIIETHSEYLIRKLQYLTAKKQVKPDDSVIYYFHDPRVKKIEILEDGSLSDDFGPGFFDEAANWELELIRLKNSKNRNN
jgi:predicted ATP-dependent endonuclease of OLD family